MGPKNKSIHANHQQAHAFTLLELLVVLAVIAVLLGLTASGLARAQEQSHQAQCFANLRQLALAEILYGNDSNDRLAQQSAGSWAWDVSTSITLILDKYGAHRQEFYCPAVTDQNVDMLWNFTQNYRVTGYAQTYPGTASVKASEQNPAVLPRQTIAGAVILPAPASAKRVLVADATVSRAGQNNTALKFTYQYTGIIGGSPVPHHASHLDVNGQFPTGGNVAMLDGHVEWVKFGDMSCRTLGGTPGYWW